MKLNAARIRMIIFGMVALVHLLLILFLRFTIHTEPPAVNPTAQCIKLVDVTEYQPPPPPPEPPKPEPKKETVEVSDQPTASEKIIEVDKQVEEKTEEQVDKAEKAPVSVKPEYIPQHKISQIPKIPVDEVLNRMVYPPLARKQGLEAVVIVELYIDQFGKVRRVVVLRDPGSGFAQAAVNALNGIYCSPAEVNGTPVAVRYRYPIRFTLN